VFSLIILNHGLRRTITAFLVLVEPFYVMLQVQNVNKFSREIEENIVVGENKNANVAKI
jgi:hypothetical protein